jgi:uncharacterized membrane protein
MNSDRFAFNRGAVRPWQCLKVAWNLIKGDYWLFLGITSIGLLLADMAPLGLLLGPMLCGIHICLLRQERGQRVSFDLLFQGFNYFGPSLVVTLIMVAIELVVVVLFSGLILAAMFGMFATLEQQRGQAPDPTWIGAFIGVMVLVVLALFFISLLLGALFMFAFPLIVDRELSGIDAVRLSMRAAMGNLGGVLLLMMLVELLAIAGSLMCCVGTFFVFPVTFAMMMVAYRQVFPGYDALAMPSQEPAPQEPITQEPAPPPPSTPPTDSNGITAT